MLREFPVHGDADPTRANHVRDQMINLHYPLHWFTDDRGLVRWAVYAVLGALCAAYLAVDWRARRAERGEGRGEMVSLSMTAVVTLLVAYHRFYDAVVLVFPLALGVKMALGASLEERRGGWVLLGLLAPFAIPLNAALLRMKLGGAIPASVGESTLWNVVVMPHGTWALVGMAAWLVWVRARVGRLEGAP
jgi:hypothetical protein